MKTDPQQNQGADPGALPPALLGRLADLIVDGLSRALPLSFSLKAGPLLTVKEVAEYLNVSTRTIETLIAAEVLDSILIRGARRVTPAAVESLIQKAAGRRTDVAQRGGSHD